jgi:hypothetical protein
MVGFQEFGKRAQRVARIPLAAFHQFPGEPVTKLQHSAIVSMGAESLQPLSGGIRGNSVPHRVCAQAATVAITARADIVLAIWFPPGQRPPLCGVKLQQSPMLREFARTTGLIALAAALAVAADDPFKAPYDCNENELQSVGLLCTEQEPCAIFLELSSVASLGRKLFVAGNIHATSGTLTSIVLGSDDGGVTWKEPAKRIPMAGLGQMQFYDLEHGWVVGEVQYPLPHDPFFLLTSDGGATWRNRALTEDGGPGSIAKFWFDSARHGEMVLDAGKSSPSGRYVDYETETGGESWMIRSTSDAMPKLARAPLIADNENFRVRPDSKGKNYEVQKRNGERWETVSQLAIEIASCKMKPQEFKDEPIVDQAPITDDDDGPKDYVQELHIGGPPVPKKTKSAPAPKGKKN